MKHIQVVLLGLLIAVLSAWAYVTPSAASPSPPASRVEVEFQLLDIAHDILRPWKLDALPPTHELRQRYEGAARDTLDALELELPDATWEERAPYARTAYVFEYGESSWSTNPMGFPDGRVLPGTNDNGLGCGALQLHIGEISKLSNWKGVLPWTCIEARKDRLIGLRAGLRVVLELEKQCGSLAAAWTAYAGKLGCRPFVAQIVKYRFKIAGVPTSR